MDTRPRPFGRGGNGSFAVLCKGAVLWGHPPYLRSVYQRTLIINKYGQGWMSEDKRAGLLTSAATRSCADFTTERDSAKREADIKKALYLQKPSPRQVWTQCWSSIVGGVYYDLANPRDGTVNGNGGLLVCR